MSSRPGVLVGEWWCSGPRLAATTLATYRYSLATYNLRVLGGKRVEEIRPRLIDHFFGHLGDEKTGMGLGPATVRKVRTVLSAVTSYGVAMEYVDSNPVMKVAPPALAPSTRVAPTLDEAARILLCAEEFAPDFLDFLWVSAEEGGHRGETLDLRWGGVDLDAGQLTFQGVVSIGHDGCHSRPHTKSKKPRRIAISSVTVGRLRERKARVESIWSAVAGHPVRVPPAAYVFSGGYGSRRNPSTASPVPGLYDPPVPAAEAPGRG